MVVQLRNPYSDWPLSHGPYFPAHWMGMWNTYGYNFSKPSPLHANPGTHYGRSRAHGNSRWFTEIPIQHDEAQDSSDESDSSASSSEDDFMRQILLSSLNLTDRDMDELESGVQLSDNHIYAAQKLLQNMYPEVEGFQDTCLSQTKFKAISNDALAVQIHHTRGNHWVVSSTMSGVVYVYDSLYTSITDDLKKQLSEIYGPQFCDEEGKLRVILPTVETQTGSLDCGLFAIAYAYELCEGNEPSAIVFNQSEMREHLITCFEQGEITNFPQMRLRRRGFNTECNVEIIDCLININ